MITIPPWLKQQPVIAYFAPEHLLFVPKRCLVYRDATPCLLDGSDRTYPLASCEPAQHCHLAGSLLLISEHGYPFRLSPKNNGLYRLTDGDREIWLYLPPPSTDEVAAKSLAEFFSGSTYTEVAADA